MAITTAAQAIYEINATNLVDGQQIKQLLIDLATFLEGLASGATPGAATTTTAGVVKQAAATGELSSVGPGTAALGLVDVGTAFAQNTLNANFATLGTLVNLLITNLTSAGIVA